MTPAQTPFPDRDSVADRFSALGEADQSFLRLLFENPAQDDALLEGLQHYLEMAASSKFLNSLKLGKAGEWVGNNAPARLQIRLTEISRSSQHPAFAAFREGLVRSGGMERAYPKAQL